jgi:hypothetical protein
VADKAEQPARPDEGRMQFTQRTDRVDEFQRSKGLNSPRGPRPPVVSTNPPTTGAAQASGSGGQDAASAQSTAGQQDGGPLNYDG